MVVRAESGLEFLDIAEPLDIFCDSLYVFLPERLLGVV